MNPWTETAGWTLIHFVWQGGLLTVATAAALRLCRGRSSEARYAIACLGLIAMVASPVITAALLRQPTSTLESGTGSALGSGPVSGPVTVPDSSGESGRVDAVAAMAPTLDIVLPVVVWAWLAGVTMLFARLAGGCWRVHRLRIACLAEPQSPWQAASERLAGRLRITAAFRVVETALVDGPGVIGLTRPVILLPAAALTNLTPLQIEALLAHELAHVRRHDYFVNLLQTVAETVLFFHPGVWRVSSWIREEREHCCDDVAVEVCGEPTAYAAALAEIASVRINNPALAVGAADVSLLSRVRRVLRVPEDAASRSVSAWAVLAVCISLTAGVAVQSLSPSALHNGQPAAVGQPQGDDRRTRNTDHFEIQYQPDLDLHAERVAREAERAYEQVSANLKHTLAFRVPVILFRTTHELEQSVQARSLTPSHASSVTDPSRDRIMLALDRPADQWLGIITHEVAHVFGFDIIPGTATARWITEGLAEYQRSAWDPSDLVTLRDAVRASVVPRLSRLHSDDARLTYALGHAAFDFIESRWGTSGVLRFLFALRQAARIGGDPYQGAFQITGDEFDRGFERYLRERFAAADDQSPAARFDYRESVRVEGDIIVVGQPVAAGLACIELRVGTGGGARQRWAVECGEGMGQTFIRALRPGDRVIITGAPARQPNTQRMVMQSILRPSDGLTWKL
jgi:beta-lactamase regulating signal transducer with metallopeptidase domain